MQGVCTILFVLRRYQSVLLWHSINKRGSKTLGRLCIPTTCVDGWKRTKCIRWAHESDIVNWSPKCNKGRCLQLCERKIQMLKGSSKRHHSANDPPGTLRTLFLLPRFHTQNGARVGDRAGAPFQGSWPLLRIGKFNVIFKEQVREYDFAREREVESPRTV